MLDLSPSRRRKCINHRGSGNGKKKDPKGSQYPHPAKGSFPAPPTEKSVHANPCEKPTESVEPGSSKLEKKSHKKKWRFKAEQRTLPLVGMKFRPVQASANIREAIRDLQNKQGATRVLPNQVNHHLFRTFGREIQIW